MVKLYRDIFFDLDRTLWDFDRNSESYLKELFVHYNLNHHLNSDFPLFLKQWRQANSTAWTDFRNGIYTKEEIRIIRFDLTFKHFNYINPNVVEQISADYVNNCPLQTHLMPGTVEILEYLSKKYRLHIITNGFSQSQRKKLKFSKLESYFKKINISDETTFRKPQRKMFQLALQRALATSENSIMIGDNIKMDIVGAKMVKMDQVHYNPQGLTQGKIVPTYTIKHLMELKEIL